MPSRSGRSRRVGVLGEPVVQVLRPARVRGVLPGRREQSTSVAGSSGTPSDGTSAHGTRCGRRAGADQPWSSHAPRNGVNTWNGVPPCVVRRPGATAYGRAGADQRHLERALDGVVASPTVRLGRRGDVHGRRPDLARDRGHHVGRAPVADHEPPAERLVERPQAPREVGQARGAGRRARAPGRRRTAARPRRRRRAPAPPRRAARGCPRAAGRDGTSGSWAPGDGSRGRSAPPAGGAHPRARPRWAHERRAGGLDDERPQERHPAQGPRLLRPAPRPVHAVRHRAAGSGSATTGCAPSCSTT